jgi:acetyl-CoA acetyltransferase
MTRAPLVMGKAQEAFQRSATVEDTTIGWRFINPLMKQQYGVDAMPETAENVAEDYQVARKDQDAVRRVRSPSPRTSIFGPTLRRRGWPS